MKIVFAGSPEFARVVLEKLTEQNCGVVAVITQPDKPTGRKKVLTPTPVKAFAEAKGLPVYDFARIREHADEVRGLGADIMITCAYGQILTREILDIFPRGVWNLHASLLPLYRGASPIQSAILAGETYTGITVMRTELELDSGDMLLVKRTEIGDADYGELSEKLSRLAADAAVEAVGYLSADEPQLLMQNEDKATYCKKISKQDVKIDFTKSAKEVCRLVRAANPQPLAYCMQNGNILNILRAEEGEGSGEAGEVLSADKNGISVACGKGCINITRLQPAGGKPLTAADFVNGRKIKAGDRLD